jgi:hypothetical protein
MFTIIWRSYLFPALRLPQSTGGAKIFNAALAAEKAPVKSCAAADTIVRVPSERSSVEQFR